MNRGIGQVKNEMAMNKLDPVVRKKAELQARGVRIPPELIAELETHYNAPAIRTGRMVLCLESPEKNGELIPAFIVSGDTSKVVQDARTLENSAIMSKPVNTDQLLRLARAAIATGIVPTE